MTTKTKTSETVKKIEKIELVDEIQISSVGKQRTIKMTFGLLNRLCRIVGDAEAAILIVTDPVIQSDILLEILAERNEDGLIVKVVDVDQYDLEREDVMVILKWAADHVLDFFLGALEMGQNLQKTHQARISVLQSGSIGSPT